MLLGGNGALKLGARAVTELAVILVCLVYVSSPAYSLSVPGDGHLHTRESWDTRAAFHLLTDEEEMVQAAKREGLDWIGITDHSDVVTQDFFFGGSLEIRDLLNDRWIEQRGRISEISDIPVLHGEELTIGNGVDLVTSGHLLTYGLTDFVASIETGAHFRRSARDLLREVREKEGFGYIAHPFNFGTWPVDAEAWDDWDLLSEFPDTIRGIELLNGGREAPVGLINLWDRMLQKGAKVYAIGNSDSHQPSRHRLLYPTVGDAFTFVHLDAGTAPTAEAILGGLRDGRATASNGPYLTVDIDGAGPGGHVSAEIGDLIQVSVGWQNEAESGPMKMIELFDQTAHTGGPPEPVARQNISGVSGVHTFEYLVREKGYLRLRAEAGTGTVAYTNPVFVDLAEAKSVSAEFPVSLAPGDQIKPDVSGDLVVWQDRRHGNWDIFLKDMSTGEERQITSGPADQIEPAVFGRTVVYTDLSRGRFDGDIYLADAVTGLVEPVCVEESGQGSPTIFQNTIVWVDRRHGNADLYMKDLVTGEERPLTLDFANQTGPSVYGDFVAFEDFSRDGNQYAFVKLLDLRTGFTETVGPHGSHEVSPQLSDRLLVWNSVSYGNYPRTDVFQRTVATGVEQPVILNAVGHSSQLPAVDDNLVVFSDDRNADEDIYAKDVESGLVRPVATERERQSDARVDGRWVVWQDRRDGDSNLYATALAEEEVYWRQTVVPDQDGSASVSFTVPALMQTVVLVRSDDSTAVFGLELRRPDGLLIRGDVDNRGKGAYFAGESGLASAHIDDPQPGAWELAITGVPGNQASSFEVIAKGVFETKPDLSFLAPGDSQAVGGPIELSATASDPHGLSTLGLFVDGTELAQTSRASLSYMLETNDLVDGPHLISAVAADSFLGTTRDDRTVIIDNVVPMADAGPPQQALAGRSVVLDGSGSLDAAEFGYHWDFGDGSFLANVGSVVEHVFTESGTFPVTLTVSDAAGTLSMSSSVVTVEEPDVRVTLDRVFWANAFDYEARILSVDLSVSNAGSIPVPAVALANVRASDGVSILTEQPIPVGALASGESAQVVLKCGVPLGVRRFSISLSIVF